MKKKILLIVILSFLFTMPVFAQKAEFSDPGMTPDSPFYFLETITEGIGTFFTFGDIKKAERYYTLAIERLAELKAVVDKGKTKLTKKTLERYEKQLNKSLAMAKKAQEKNQNNEKVTEVLSKVGKATHKHLDVLAEVYEKVPEQAKSAVENAMKASLKGHERAVEVLQAKNALGEVPDKVSVPKNVSKEAKERIQMGVQQELWMEKIVEQVKEKALQGSESPRDFCLKLGASAEKCEKFPADGFESFESLKANCIETGGPPEYCGSLEAKCKEMGVTKADDCFRVISSATLKAFQSAELKSQIAPVLGKEEVKQMEQNRIKQQESIKVKLESDGKIIEKTVEELEAEGAEKAPTKVIKISEQRYVPSASKVIIYSAPTCPHCAKAKNWLQGNNIKYEEFDISQDKIKQNELMEKVGRLAVPIIEVGNDIIVGFNEGKLSELLGIE